MPVWIIAVVLLLTVMGLCGRVTANYAVQRGRSRRAWFLLGALFSPLFPVLSIVLALLPSRRRNNAALPG